MSAEIKRVHAVVEGLVQGVGFRYFVAEVAEELGVAGWVRNTYGGDVEVLAEGTCEQLDRLVTMLRQGPRAAHVINVDVTWQRATSEFSNFQVRSTV